MDSVLNITDNDLKEIFSIFCSCTKHELKQIYNSKDHLYYLHLNLSDDYNLNEKKREYALDSIRSIFYWLHKNGYCISKDGKIDNLNWIEEYFY